MSTLYDKNAAGAVDGPGVENAPSAAGGPSAADEPPTPGEPPTPDASSQPTDSEQPSETSRASGTSRSHAKASVRERFPLDAAEERALAANLAATQALLLVGGLLGTFVVCGLATASLSYTVFEFGWARMLASSLTAAPPLQTLGVGLALAVVFALAAWFAERQASKTEAGRAAVLDARRGLNGELPRLSVPLLCVLLLLTGCAEELLFRYVLLGGAALLFAYVMPSMVAMLWGLVISALVFWFAHVRYRDVYSTVVVLVLAFALGIAFLVTGSLAVVIVAHACYDIAGVLAERVQMSREADYFGGPAPHRVVLDMVEAQAKAQAEARAAKGDAAADAEDVVSAGATPQAAVSAKADAAVDGAAPECATPAEAVLEMSSAAEVDEGVSPTSPV